MFYLFGLFVIHDHINITGSSTLALIYHKAIILYSSIIWTVKMLQPYKKWRQNCL